MAGNFLRSENYDKGVITFTTLKKVGEQWNEEGANQSSSQQTKKKEGSTKSGGVVVDEGELSTVYVTGINLKELKDFYGRLEDYMNNLFSELKPVTDYTEKEEAGGGGGSRNREKYFTVTEIQHLCLEKERKTTYYQVLKGDSVFLEAKESADSLCLFMGWFSETSEGRSRDKRLTLSNIQNDITVSAKYTSPTHNSNCYELMQLLSTDGRLKILDTLMKEFNFSREVLAKFSDGKIDLVRGKYKKVEFYFEEALYDGFAHSHEEDDCFPSDDDIAVFVANFLKYRDLSKVYCDILSWDKEKNQHRLLMLNITNIKTFLNQIKNIEMFLNQNQNKNIEQLLKDFFKEDFKKSFKNINNKSDKYFTLINYLKLYGMSYRLITVSGGKNVINWGDYDPVYGENVPNSQWQDSNANIYDCFYRMF